MIDDPHGRPGRLRRRRLREPRGVNVVPRNLVARIPDGVSFEEAAFGTLGAIALQGVRRSGAGPRRPRRGAGARAPRPDHRADAEGGRRRRDRRRRATGPRRARCRHSASTLGFTVSERDFVAGVLERTGGQGADAVIVTAAGGDAGLLNKAFEACRRKGRVVLVGDVPDPDPARQDLQEGDRLPDLDLVRARPLRPGLRGEGPGLSLRLRALDRGSQPRGGAAPDRRRRALRVKPLIDATHRVEDASAAYLSLASRTRPIGVLLDYHLDAAGEQRPASVSVPPGAPAAAPAKRARSASGWSATAATSARCCCRC